MISITPDVISEMISENTFSFLKNGDPYEQEYYRYIEGSFPRCEEFWKWLVVPMTGRVDPSCPQDFRGYPRDGVSGDIQLMCAQHYTVFLNLIYAHNHLDKCLEHPKVEDYIRNTRLSSFEDFYTHLCSACDLTEDFLISGYQISQRCKGIEIVIPPLLTHDGFLANMEDYYDGSYEKDYKNCLSRGKHVAVRVPRRDKYLADEYLIGFKPWKEYKAVSQRIREYRNVIIHNVQIGKVLDRVPKKKFINKYKTWESIYAVRNKKNILENEFIPMNEQMSNDVDDFERKLNDLWAKPIEDLRILLFEEQNEHILAMYHLPIQVRQVKATPIDPVQHIGFSHGSREWPSEVLGNYTIPTSGGVAPSGMSSFSDEDYSDK